jgi:sugar phosphate isomerase/epimerase
LTPTVHLGVNTCFAVKRWPEPARWADLVAGTLGLDECQLTLDLLDPGLEHRSSVAYAESARRAAADAGVVVHSVFTGLGAYATNLLLHPDAALREAATGWFERAIEVAAAAGSPAVGGFLGAFSSVDAADAVRRRALLGELAERLHRLADAAAAAGLELLLMENMSVRRELGSVIEEAHLLEAMTAGSAVPWVLCLDVGHPCALVSGTASDDPLSWLAERWRHPPVLQLQQANGDGDHHWPFTAERNAEGSVDAAAVASALSAVAADELHLFLEVVHRPEVDDAVVLDDLRASVAHWRRVLAGDR